MANKIRLDGSLTYTLSTANLDELVVLKNQVTSRYNTAKGKIDNDIKAMQDTIKESKESLKALEASYAEDIKRIAERVVEVDKEEIAAAKQAEANAKAKAKADAEAAKKAKAEAEAKAKADAEARKAILEEAKGLVGTK